MTKEYLRLTRSLRALFDQFGTYNGDNHATTPRFFIYPRAANETRKI